MPELVDQMYCSQQIVIPPKFPYILKKYCKAAIKTQPYDLLRWSFEYFKAMAENRKPPVKIRLEYPIYSSEGGLTRGCLKVLCHQLAGMEEIPIPIVKRAWRGFCLDYMELVRILCLCEVYLRSESVPYLHFIAVAGGLLTKCLTNTMILLCETLTKEPDGGSAAIPVEDFLRMYRFLAAIDASADVKYFGGYREGQAPEVEAEEEETPSEETEIKTVSTDSFWEDAKIFRHLTIIDDKMDDAPRISTRSTKPLIGVIERSPSVERANQIERENYLSDRKGKPTPSEDVDKQLQKLSALHLEGQAPGGEEKPKEVVKEAPKSKDTDKDRKDVQIFVFDEDDKPVEYEIYGEPAEVAADEAEDEATGQDDMGEAEAEQKETIVVETEAEKIAAFVAAMMSDRDDRIEDLEITFAELATIVDRFNSANYDLGMVAGRQMSTTSGEFIVQHIERDIMDYINEQIAVLPDPDLKKKKAKPEEVEMVRGILEAFIEENMDIIVPEIEEVEEEEQPIPEITIVYAVPGIGPAVDHDIVADFVDYAKEVSKDTEVIMPRMIRHYLCPPLEKYVEYYDKADKEISENLKWGKNEEAPVGGTMTD